MEAVKAKDVMRVATVLRPDDPAEDLLSLFKRPGLRAVSVVSPQGELIGLVTDQDLLGAVLPPYVVEDPLLARPLAADAIQELHLRLTGKRVKDVVSIRRPRQPPVDLDDSLIEVTSRLVRSGDPAVAVIKDDVLVGLITVDDLLSALVALHRP